MDWQIKTLSRKSSLTGEAFQPGDRAVSLVFKEESSGELGRADLHESELESFELRGQLLGRWTRVIRDPEDDADHARETMASAEDFFFSLYEETADKDAGDVSDTLKYILALMLERKRVLKVVGPRQFEGSQLYRHVKNKQEVSVPLVDISRGLMLKIEDTLGELIA
jgi:hypothetical protein